MSIRRLIYSIAIYFLVPIIVLRLFIRSRKNPAFLHRILERFGFIPTITDKPVIWLHAVSVGEVLAAKPLINRLIEQYHNHHILVTCTTLTGSEALQNTFASRIKHYYFPYDLFGSLRRFIKRSQPSKLIIMETEIWPNLYASCKKQNIPIIIANARLSQRAMKSYLKLQTLVAETLSNVCLIAARGKEDAKHFKQLGATDKHLQVIGNIKFDLELPEQQIDMGKVFRQQWGENRLVLVAASTHKGEDAPILSIYQKLLESVPDLLLVLVPRHPERFDEVYQLAQQTDLQVQRRSSGDSFQQHNQIIIGDSMGEMFSWYAAADIVFMGGSLVETGGHNPLEPAALAKPVVCGPYTFNFSELFPLLEKQGAAWVMQDEQSVYEQLLTLLNKPELRAKAGNAGKSLLEQHQGVIDVLLEKIASC